ncbi:LysR substrate-binding domain-containing protein [Streptomyces sp. NPDC020883]|uniref:LysR substrate-binding domain-containing protein n=1 Tax=Streptomyces sp. NPDC020883 TaxID=3365099 RepID=UPI00378BB871
MPVTLDIAPLRSLVAVAACGGFHKAAGALHLTQAAVSRHVQRLEDGLGAELVVREGRSIRFTPAGERMLAHAHTILEAHDAAVDEFRTRTGTFTIGAMDHAADLLLPGLVDEVRAALPHRTVQVRLGRSARLRDAMANHQLDAALVLERLADEPAGRGILPTHWVGGARPAAAEPLAAPLPLVLFDDHCGLRTGALRTLNAARIRYRIVAEAPDLAGIQSAVRAGLGYTLLPRLGRLPDRLHPAHGLPVPPGVVVGVRIADHVGARDARTVRRLIRAGLQDRNSSGTTGTRDR